MKDFVTWIGGPLRITVIDAVRDKPETGNRMNEDPVGLCAQCAHVKIIQSDRRSVFYQCRRSFIDSRFPKYPQLPVRNCLGYEELPPGACDNIEART